MPTAPSFLTLLDMPAAIAGEVVRGCADMGGTDLARHRAPAHHFERGRSSDILIVAQQNIASRSAAFDLGFGWREHFCPAPTAVYVVPADADARWRLDGESQCVYMALPAVDADAMLREFDVASPSDCLWGLAGGGFDESLVHTLVVRLWEEVSLVGPSPLLGSSCRVSVLHALARRYQRSRRPDERTLPRLSRAVLARVLDLMGSLPPQGLSIEAMAQEAGLSTFHFARLFRNTTGQAPYRYYDELRFRRACDLLSATDTPVADIGRQLGFAHASQFTRAFRRHAGCAPSLWRDRGRGRR